MRKQLPEWLWLLLGIGATLLIGFLDWLTGYHLSFFVFYFIPIAIVAWFVGIWAALFMAVFCSLVWFEADILAGHDHLPILQTVWNIFVRLASFLTIGWSVSKIQYAFKREHDASESLRVALSQVKVLEAFLPICAQCKKIKNQQGEWQNLEDYIGEHANTRFSHGYCPECAKKAMEEAGLGNKK